MVKRIPSIEVVSSVLLAVCWAVCQDARQSLPDAPSVQAATEKRNFNKFTEEARSALSFGSIGRNADVTRQLLFADPDKAVPSRKDPDAIFRKYLYPTQQKQASGYRTSSRNSLMGRATSAASRTLIARDDSGKARLNTAYLLHTLTVVAKDAASTPYWRRSPAGPFSDFGSSVGNDAGSNLWREFRPGIQQLMKSHTPRFVFRIEERVTPH